jgi:integrase/recombinase XerD
MIKEEALGSLRNELEKRKSSELTVKNYTWFVNKLIESRTKDKEINNISIDDAQKFLSQLANQKSKNTISLATASLKFFFSEVLKQPAHFQTPQIEAKPQEKLNEEEILTLINAAETKKSKLIINFIYSTGLKASTIVHLKKEHLNLEEKNGKFLHENKEITFTLSEKILAEIKEHLEKHPNYVYLFSKEKPLSTRNIQKIIKKTAQKAKIEKKVTPNLLSKGKI